jgi:hypothetical protein
VRVGVHGQVRWRQQGSRKYDVRCWESVVICAATGTSLHSREFRAEVLCSCRPSRPYNVSGLDTFPDSSTKDKCMP